MWPMYAKAWGTVDARDMHVERSSINGDMQIGVAVRHGERSSSSSSPHVEEKWMFLESDELVIRVAASPGKKIKCTNITCIERKLNVERESFQLKLGLYRFVSSYKWYVVCLHPHYLSIILCPLRSFLLVSSSDDSFTIDEKFFIWWSYHSLCLNHHLGKTHLSLTPSSLWTQSSFAYPLSQQSLITWLSTLPLLPITL